MRTQRCSFDDIPPENQRFPPKDSVSSNYIPEPWLEELREEEKRSVFRK